MLDETGRLDLATLDLVGFQVLDSDGAVVVNPITGELEAAVREGQGTWDLTGSSIEMVSAAQAQLAAPRAAHAVAPHCAAVKRAGRRPRPREPGAPQAEGVPAGPGRAEASSAGWAPIRARTRLTAAAMRSGRSSCR